MARALAVVPADDVTVVFGALRDALAGGPAVLPGTPSRPVPPEVEQRIALVVETSGSTGRPKRVALGADALLASAAASESSLGGPGQWLLALPTHYIAGINVLVRSITADTDPIVMPLRHFDPQEFAAATVLMDAPLRFTSLVPAQLGRLVEAAGEDFEVLAKLRRLDRILVGGQATSPELLSRAIELGLNVTRTYGSSETSGGCVYDGMPIGSAEVRIVDGQVELAGPMLAEGYLDDPEATTAAFVVHDGLRWYRTGDAGTIDDGVLRVSGRLDDVIISGGEKVSLHAVEEVVRSIAGLQDAVVVRAPSVEWGEVPVVFSSGRASLESVKATVVARLGRASAPIAIVTVQGVPMLSSGKPDRISLTAFAASRGVSAGGQ
ncbi:MAG: o-succinylbenzoate---CoA ligase [Microbacteriaceae bacterium]|jgi:O-succinylbenzoic acid--CoA ligase|nr:o-succinylbenzoate---CoA ligase [Microbacteriaceae bacterium]